jgi:hypothetical protein
MKVNQLGLCLSMLDIGMTNEHSWSGISDKLILYIFKNKEV